MIEKGADGTFSAYPATLKTMLIGEGPTAEDAIADFRNSYAEFCDYCRERGTPLPRSLVNPEFEFRYDVASLFSRFSFINATKFAEAVGVEPSLMRHYKSGGTSISRVQAKKIERGLHTLARELQSVTL